MTASIAAAAPTDGARLWVQWTLSNRRCPTVVAFAGEIDAGNADHLVDTLSGVFEVCVERLVIDLTAVEFLDPAGATALLRARRIAQARSLRLDVVSPARIARRVLTVDGDDEQVEFFDTVADALRSRPPGADQEQATAGS